jgi:pimeloyl-ACP methyl ester carboxylesterase
MGGQIATLLAATRPARFGTLTLMNPVPVEGLRLPDKLQVLFRNCGGKRDELGRILDMACLALAPEDRERLIDDAESIDARVIGEGFDAWMRGVPGASAAGATMPATVVATDDPFLPRAFLEQAVVARLPQGRLRVLAGAGHYPQVELPEATAELLKDLWR